MSHNHKPYLVDAVIGNSKMLASLTKDGRIHRLWWPHIDFPQHVDCMRHALLVNGELSWFDDEAAGWQHEASYTDRTKIVNIRASSAAHPVEVHLRMFAVPGEDALVRHYSFRNTSEQMVEADFLHYTSFQISENPLYNTVMFDPESDALIHFRREYFFAVSGSNVCTKYQAGKDVWRSISQGHLDGTNIDMSPDGALAWSLRIPPGSTCELTVYITAGTSQEEAVAALGRVRELGYTSLLEQTTNYWQQFLEHTVPCPIEDPQIQRLYERSLLTMKLMSDEQSGAVIAAPEFDEHFAHCGGYAYCWGRDAAFIASAMDRGGLTSLADRFYEWSLTAQSPDGSWQQRHYHDGRLAPSWGLQIDEGGSILWGMWQHYLVVEDRAFADRVWPSVRRGAEFLMSYLDEETGLPLPSNDLWEERIGEHVYSAAAVYGGLQAAASFAELLGEAASAAEWRQAAERIRESIRESCWNEEKGAYLRGLKLSVDEATYMEETRKGRSGYTTTDSKGYTTYILREDPIVDISLLGLCTPFGLFPADDPRIARTADTIEALLTVPGVGGIKRYEDDPYIGGNPWILTTLWLCQYRILQGRLDDARRLLQWAIDHQTELGLLPEQIDRETGQTAWVVPLTWSHAMFILAVHMLADAEQAQR